MKFGISTSFRNTLQLHDISFDYIEENVQSFLVPEQAEEDFAATLLAVQKYAPLPIEAANSFIPSSLPIVNTPQQKVDTQRLEQYVRTALRRAEQAGIQVIVLGSGAARACPPDYDQNAAEQQILEHLATWSPWAAQHGVQLVLEPLRYQETNTFNTVAASAAGITSIANSGARLLIDTYHMASNGEEPATIVPASPVLAHAHVAELQDRAAPGRYGEDLTPYFAALDAAHYDQRITIECRWFSFVDEANPAITALKEQWNRATSS